jgi:hypothetical protein
MDLLFYIVLSAALVAGMITQLKWAQVEDLALPQHADQHRPDRPILLALDQQLGEGAAFRIAPELSDPVGLEAVRQAYSRFSLERLLVPRNLGSDDQLEGVDPS